MSNLSFDNYTAVAQKKTVSNTEVAGRYGFQDVAEKAILADLVRKLSLDGSDTLLEVGCGPGNLLIPLSYWVAHGTGIDNEIALARLNARGADAARVTTLAGNFLTMPLPTRVYSKILVYSVIQYLDTLETALAFIGRALSLLQPGGRMLLGDLPNSDKKKRWSSSSAGIEVGAAWKQQINAAGEHPLADLPIDAKLVTVNDQFVMNIMLNARQAGVESYLLSQSPALPFGNSREDILFVRHK